METMEKKLALIIEDDPHLNEIFSLTLQDNFIIESVHDGREAISLLNEMVPDVVILDLHLPNVTGDQILSVIRSNEQMRHTRVILTTADAQMAESLNDEADLVLLKPISPIQLLDLVKRISS